jgi:hypothetical protein
MPEATVCPLPYAFRVWGLMKLKNKLISSPFWTDPEHNQDLFFARGGIWESFVVFHHTRRHTEKCGYSHFLLIFSKTIKLPQKFAEHNRFLTFSFIRSAVPKNA